MKEFIYDDTFEGLLTAIFYAYSCKNAVIIIKSKDYIPSLFNDVTNIKTEIDNNKKNIDNLKNEQIEENKIDNKQIEKYINEFLSLENPTRELIINLVEKIYIYQDKQVDIIFTFKNVT